MHQDRNREAMKERERGKEEMGKEIEDEACDTQKETEKGEELCIDSATFTV